MYKFLAFTSFSMNEYLNYDRHIVTLRMRIFADSHKLKRYRSSTGIEPESIYTILKETKINNYTNSDVDFFVFVVVIVFATNC